MKNLIKQILCSSIVVIFLSNISYANKIDLPDFTSLVEENSASIVNISTVRKNNKQSNRSK